MTTHSHILADLIRTGRIRRGWNQSELAEKAGVSRTTLHFLEQGELERPRPSTLGKLAAALDLPAEQLLQPGNLGTATTPAVDRTTNPAVTQLAAAEPQLFAHWTDAEWDELYSTFGCGGALHLDGAREQAAHINQRREVTRQLHIILETHLGPAATALIQALYQQVTTPPPPPTT